MPEQTIWTHWQRRREKAFCFLSLIGIFVKLKRPTRISVRLRDRKSHLLSFSFHFDFENFVSQTFRKEFFAQTFSFATEETTITSSFRKLLISHRLLF